MARRCAARSSFSEPPDASALPLGPRRNGSRSRLRARLGDPDLRPALSAAMRCVPFGPSGVERFRERVSRSRLSDAAGRTAPRHDRGCAALPGRIRKRSHRRKPALYARRSVALRYRGRERLRVFALQSRCGRRTVGTLSGLYLASTKTRLLYRGTPSCPCRIAGTAARRFATLWVRGDEGSTTFC